MMSFLDLVSRLLRAIPLQARGSTDRPREAGGGPSGADFFIAELELQSCPATPQPPICSTSHDSEIITNTPAEPHIHIQLPEQPEPAVLYTGRGITSPSLLVLHPIDSAGSFNSGSNSSNSSSNDSSSTNISEGKGRGIHPHGDDAVDRRQARKQRESSVCWREYWG
ncbi:hypothetical protein F4813DRAFT_344720 [Daldinia decipiens]|uniref:uncharacterized protein n=1 Tax=Daldinia decipiens TaxID=326647 RepID=UPI0020C39C15|nr:uncharacterized protein F4813DRAFT_344720 [Daldinia decipiens]KAI1662489.1 hypothetical protein F4813DRAFT_344720 [Daldinia decipiens]